MTTATTTRANRLPDFAGVALVDILANGLAMLIIVIVLSIAARAEQEARTSAQVEEVETMMSRRFSTSLVLNSLAASPPARLHDYQTSPLDQEHDPLLLPVIELHKNFVRELYTGAAWSREELLFEANAFDDYLAAFDDTQRARLRTDVYDVAQFYLAMSILRDHGIAVRHWHFLEGGGLSVAAAGDCPPGVAAKDCGGGGGGSSALPSLVGGGDGDGGGWPPAGFGDGDGGGGDGEQTPFPGGAEVGGVGDGAGGVGGEALGAGSFPDARGGGDGEGRGLLGGGVGGDGEQTRFRLSSPESLREDGRALDFGGRPPTPEDILSALLAFVGELQATLDAGRSPAALLANFESLIRAGLAAPPVLDDSARYLVRALAADLTQPFAAAGDDLTVTPLTLDARADTALIVPTNRRLRAVAVARTGDTDPAAVPTTARPVLRLNAHPDIWRGLSVRLEPGAVVLLPPAQRRADAVRWRALAYIAPEFNDFIIGFAFASVGDGALAVAAEDNRVRLSGQALTTPRQSALFGARSWLVALYAALAFGLLGALWMRRLGARSMVAAVVGGRRG